MILVMACVGTLLELSRTDWYLLQHKKFHSEVITILTTHSKLQR